jgi:hypothetical protein
MTLLLRQISFTTENDNLDRLLTPALSSFKEERENYFV